MASPQDQKIALNLDVLEREKVYEPFVFAVDGIPITLNDPKDLDFNTLLQIQQPAQFLRHCISADDRTELRKHKIPGWKFEKIIEGFMRHYGLDDLPNGAGSGI